jgi:hypothetical protein
VDGLPDSSTRIPVSPFSGSTKWILQQNDCLALALATCSSREMLAVLHSKPETLDGGEIGNRIGIEHQEVGRRSLREIQR